MLGTKWQVSISTTISGRGKVQPHHVGEEGGKVSSNRKYLASETIKKNSFEVIGHRVSCDHFRLQESSGVKCSIPGMW